MTETEISLERKLKILADAAKYDVACTSSGSSRRGKKGHLGNTVSAGICHTFSSDGRCVSLLKILFSNDCVFDCKYCPSRAANEKERATFTPEEICRLVVEFMVCSYYISPLCPVALKYLSKTRSEMSLSRFLFWNCFIYSWA